MSNQILWDCHMHSSFSADSDTSMEDMIREAICRGLTGICFTEHLDPDYPPTPDNEIFELDLDGYRKTLFRLREKYQNYRFISVLSLVCSHICTTTFTSFWQQCRLIL